MTAPPRPFDAWIVKFKSNLDPSAIGKEEYAYSLMARDAGIDMPPTKLLIETTQSELFRGPKVR